jgi:hypothetical protein
MHLKGMLVNPVSAIMLAACAALATPAQADTIGWTTWTSATSGSPGSATGTIGSLTVTYSGQTSGLLHNYPSWGPTSTFTGGVVGNPPPAANNSVQLQGGVSYTETITFSSVVADPIFAVWSLGAPTVPASFIFTASEPFTVQGGGPSNEFGGTPLFISGESVEGNEGNGIIQFNGNFTSITFTTPQYENYYAFTIGEDQTLTDQLPSPVPEPATFSLFGLGLAALPLVRRSLARLRS